MMQVRYQSQQQIVSYQTRMDPPSYDQITIQNEFSKMDFIEKTTFQTVTRPIVIPQTTTTLLHRNSTPFCRAYPKELATIGIEKAEFMKIVDELNECFLLNPGFRIVQMAGMVIGCVPSPTLVGIGAGIQLAAGLAGAGTSYARTKAYVKKVNETVFHTKGYQMKIVQTKKMMKLIGEGENETKIQLPPLPHYGMHEWNATNSSEIDPRMRRMKALGDKVSELDWNVPTLVMPKNTFRKVGNWEAKRQAKSFEKKHEKMCLKATNTQKQSVEKCQERIQKMEKKEAKTSQRIRWIVIVPKTEEEEDVDLSEEVEKVESKD